MVFIKNVTGRRVLFAIILVGVDRNGPHCNSGSRSCGGKSIAGGSIALKHISSRSSNPKTSKDSADMSSASKLRMMYWFAAVGAKVIKADVIRRYRLWPRSLYLLRPVDVC